MSNWFRIVTEDITKIPDCIEYFEAEAESARKDLSLKGKTIERHSAEMPGIVEHRFSQLQELEAILEFLNIEYRKVKTSAFKKFLEAYNRSLSSRDADRYADGDPDVIAMALLVNEFALVRNKFISITKGLDQKSWMIGHVTKLRTAGLEDVEIR